VLDIGQIQNLNFLIKLEVTRQPTRATWQLVYLPLGPCDVNHLHPRDRLLQVQNLRTVAARSNRIKRSSILLRFTPGALGLEWRRKCTDLDVVCHEAPLVAPVAAVRAHLLRDERGEAPQHLLVLRRSHTS
jgi:hypothetical protein